MSLGRIPPDSGDFVALEAGIDSRIGRQRHNGWKVEHLARRIDCSKQILGAECRNLEMALQRRASGVDLRSRQTLRLLKLILGSTQCTAGLPDIVELENGLNLFRTPGGLDRMKRSISRRECDFRMVGNLGPDPS